MAACSHEDVAGLESEFSGSAARPGDGHHGRTAAQFDVQDCTRQLRMSWAATGGGAIVRGKPMNSPVFLADSDHLAPAMNDVDINIVDGKGGGFIYWRLSAPGRRRTSEGGSSRPIAAAG